MAGRSLLLAVQFLTRLPVRVSWSDQAAGRSLLYYPLVGLAMGLLLLLLAWPLGGAAAGLAAAVLLTVWVLASAALHLDGLADAADAWLGGQGDRERTLEIMKDPRCGPMAVVVLVLLLLLKWQALAELLARGEAGWALLLAPVLGRLSALALFRDTPYVRAGGLGSALAAYLPRDQALWVLGGVLLLAVLVPGGLWAVLAAALMYGGCRWLMLRRLGGITGDTTGALIELVELAVLLALALQA
ncbi:adenosylcobinamide-GDP ribazoletransferase [Alkalilimnicola sp. S0819]|uniref:adenosylcobinamide-GDP ribazoletransferase n=1 Tax=Alkalilimnicola sp. S0819 TaxID=2613922 RepID=UPI001261C631|nr:adenosylcobinamide-GDP ribazoletransferase [Alkalilimnicola sp. S0819]KAB7623371.1 adenosylcobinamide-GDP ribazoletransferase [Alkalilimnicola sp. S0819]MPQ16911.1 adenosylcobinamide-GDP ribazoletransferase [Alkalilimnicola sp. S0819]